MVSQESVVIEVSGRRYDGVYNVPDVASGYAVILTHGAGGDMHFPQLAQIADLLAQAGLLCLRFTCKGLNLVHRSNVYRGVLNYLMQSRKDTLKGCFLAGRSMGSRAAVATANNISEEKATDQFVKGVICFAYPLHKSKDESNLRDAPLLELSKPCLFISGTKDEMCQRDLLQCLASNKDNFQISWVDGGDHGCKIKGKDASDVVVDFMDDVTKWIGTHQYGQDPGAVEGGVTTGTKVSKEKTKQPDSNNHLRGKRKQPNHREDKTIPKSKKKRTKKL